MPHNVTMALACLAGLATTALAGHVQSLNFLGQDTFPTNTSVLGTNMGGLSGITYDAANARYHSIADDRSQINPARFYTLNLDLTGNTFGPGRTTFTGVTTLLQPGGLPFPNAGIDPESIALAPNGDLWISSEGDANALQNPFVNRFSIAGQQNFALPIPAKFNASAGGTGIRNNLAFETLTISPSGSSLFTATENALKQDGPAAALGVGTNSRILRFDTAINTPAQEFVYQAGPVIDPPVPAGSFTTNGLVDMLALDDTTFIAMERSFSVGVGNRIRLYEVSLTGATDVSGQDPLGVFTPVTKTLLLDLDVLGITLDNVEGLTFGPDLTDGRKSLILVSDNNFSATQFTQFLAFGVTIVPAPSTLALLAGAGMVIVGRRRR